MIDQARFRREQRRIALCMAAALAVAVAVVGSVVALDTAPPQPFGTRLQAALRLDLGVVAWLSAAIAHVARLRFVSPQDIDGSAGGPPSIELRVADAILRNTLEQVALAVLAHLVLAASFARATNAIAALVGLFAIGRLLFWIGYRHGAAARAFGFALSFYPSVLALLASAGAILFGA